VDKYSGKLLGELSYVDSRTDVALSEKFIAGTQPSSTDTSHAYASVCADSGYLATPYCEHTYYKLGIIRPGGMSWEKTLASYHLSYRSLKANSVPDAVYDLPDYYCPLHNPDPAAYPISPYWEDHIDDEAWISNLNEHGYEGIDGEDLTDPEEVTGGAIEPGPVEPADPGVTGEQDEPDPFGDTGENEGGQGPVEIPDGVITDGYLMPSQDNEDEVVWN
jgi:hypothetical protein